MQNSGISLLLPPARNPQQSWKNFYSVQTANSSLPLSECLKEFYTFFKIIMKKNYKILFLTSPSMVLKALHQLQGQAGHRFGSTPRGQEHNSCCSYGLADSLVEAIKTQQIMAALERKCSAIKLKWKIFYTCHICIFSPGISKKKKIKNKELKKIFKVYFPKY